jgi:hypothetical protein
MHEAGTDLRVLQQRRGGHPASICPADFESVRSNLVSMGFDEAVTPGEIGGVVAWNFYRSDLVLTVIPGDLVFTSSRTECVRVITQLMECGRRPADRYLAAGSTR